MTDTDSRLDFIIDEEEENLKDFQLNEDCPTIDEIREILGNQEKRQERLLRNREAAKQSRQRNRDALKLSRLRCAELEKENEQLKMFVHILKMDNFRLHGMMSGAKVTAAGVGDASVPSPPLPAPLPP